MPIIKNQDGSVEDIYVAEIHVRLAERWVNVYRESFTQDTMAIHAVWMEFMSVGPDLLNGFPRPTETYVDPYKLMGDWLYRVLAEHNGEGWQLTVRRTQVHSNYTHPKEGLNDKENDND